MFFKCKHPFEQLVVLEIVTEPYDEDFNHVTHHFTCGKCFEKLTKKYSSCVGGVDNFLRRPASG